MKRFLGLVIFCIVHCALCIEIGAVPAKPVVKDSVLADGTVVRMVLRGDEFFHYYEIEQGEGNNAQCTMHNAQCTISHSALRLLTLNSQLSTLNFEKGLVILVEFADRDFKMTRQNFDDQLNKEGYDYNGATGSARDYFRAASTGQYVPQFDVFGPYRLDRKMSYYGENAADGLDLHPDQMVVDAVAKLNAAEDIDFADYDTDSDGYIDNIFVYYAGYGENEGAPESTIWPHAWEVYEDYVAGQLEYDGKQLGRYACTSELKGTSGVEMCGIGTFCHEFSHVLGLPDFYVTDYSSAHKTLGDWDIMDAGAYLNDGNTPPTYSAHERFYLGWLTPEVLNTAGDYELEELQKSNKAYMITATGEHNLDGADPDSKTYYLLENRQNTGWDAYLPGHGLMITKTVYDEVTWYNNVPNNNRYAQGYDLIEADGKAPNDNYGKAGDLFPGTAGVTSYAPYAKYPITKIEEVDGVIGFAFMGGESGEEPDVPDEPGGDDVVVGDCFVETFEGLTANGGTDITATIDDYADNAGWEGFKLFCAMGQLKVGSSKKAGYVTTPALPMAGDVEVTFVGSAYKDDAVISFEIDGEVVKEIDVTSKKETHRFDIDGLAYGAQMTISSSDKRFYLDELRVCAKEEVSTDVEEVSDRVVMVMRNGRCELHGVEAGTEVECYDMMGRLVWRRVAEGDVMEVDAPRGVFVVRVGDLVVKGVGSRE